MYDKRRKELLIKDLIARLQYGVVLKTDNVFPQKLEVITFDNGTFRFWISDGGFTLDNMDCIPYLRPMSSMTKEEKIDYERLCSYCLEQDTVNYNITTLDKTQLVYVIDWLNKNHFDYRGLIEKGLAIDATGLNIY